MKIENSTYSIQQVSEITGLSKQVIRKWEERYQIVNPERLENGYRIYSEADINTILKVKGLVDQGHTVKQAAYLVEKGGSPSDQSLLDAGWKKKNQYEELNEFVLDLLKEGTHCNEAAMNIILQQAYHQKGLEFFIQSVVIPFLHEVGNRWEKGQWGEYQESLASLTVRDFLVQLRRNFKYRENAPTLLGACLPYEQHEVPVLILLIQAMLKGWKTILIGASPAEGSIEKTIQKLEPDKVILSATTTFPFEQDPAILSKLEKFASDCKKTRFYIGGPGAINYLSNRSKLQFIQLTHSLNEVLE
ncbi:DNA-binding transcriptional MerR regulator [Bacillus sp. SLBN-46]|jgi:MerR family transcriptional regulator, light-induced transcriptional regulator|uniref:MerR family transcriptional regulator n=1 Tax=Bacillus sp. SLBN-46 TaxID=3042283 RepID=UPI002854D428|nr:MerR family transcriptional regulator [Bacillus sp. SLBN-46]MDR6124115.1 DNA-binding transcriptional MerR regulator [Bacillus sp. SLBN-46]